MFSKCITQSRLQRYCTVWQDTFWCHWPCVIHFENKSAMTAPTVLLIASSRSILLFAMQHAVMMRSCCGPRRNGNQWRQSAYRLGMEVDSSNVREYKGYKGCLRRFSRICCLCLTCTYLPNRWPVVTDLFFDHVRSRRLLVSFSTAIIFSNFITTRELDVWVKVLITFFLLLSMMTIMINNPYAHKCNAVKCFIALALNFVFVIYGHVLFLGVQPIHQHLVCQP